MDRYLTDKTGFYPANILLPDGQNWNQWAVVACDQFTSDPEYWESVKQHVGASPSTLNLIIPEVFLNASDLDVRILKVNQKMDDYLKQGIFHKIPSSMIYVERTQSDGSIRHGLIGMIDLEQYEFAPGNKALIRATEGIVSSRIPPRVHVRTDASLELPHVMLLIDDFQNSVIGPLTEASDYMKKLYDFELQQDGGHIKGFQIRPEDMEVVEKNLAALATSQMMEAKYGVREKAPMLFAVGDGNHSLATAKKCYEIQKECTPKEEWDKLPLRHALVEVVNLHDEALQFEPIHRVLFNVNPQEVIRALHEYYPDAYEGTGEGQVIQYCYGSANGSITIPHPAMQLAVGTLQRFLDAYVEGNPVEMDYIHDEEEVRRLCSESGNLGFLLPAMKKEELFRTVIHDGILPRKTFSMGHAADKRYYIEARKIR